MNVLNRYTGAVLREVGGDTLSEADLSGADLSEADLSGANLRGANLREADLSEADLSGANLREADLSGADLRGANLRGADLRGANLSWANLSEADLSEADLREANGLTALGDILRIAGTRHPIWCIDADNLSIGCRRNSLAWWRENAAAAGASEGYTPAQIAEYQRHIEYCAEWLAAKAVAA